MSAIETTVADQAALAEIVGPDQLIRAIQEGSAPRNA
jgi:hypothetical protein